MLGAAFCGRMRCHFRASFSMEDSAARCRAEPLRRAVARFGGWLPRLLVPQQSQLLTRQPRWRPLASSPLARWQEEEKSPPQWRDFSAGSPLYYPWPPRLPLRTPPLTRATVQPLMHSSERWRRPTPTVPRSAPTGASRRTQTRPLSSTFAAWAGGKFARKTALTSWCLSTSSSRS